MLYSLAINDAALAVQTIRRKISMKRNLALRALATVASSALLAGAFSVGALAPAQAATSSTVTQHDLR
jgi:hypothetical protein